MKIKHRRDDRSSLYYNRWKYSINFRLEYGYLARDLDHASLDQRIRSRASRWPNQIGVSTEMVENLHHLITLMTETPAEYKMVVCYHWVYVYTNDEDLIKSIGDLPYIQNFFTKRAWVTLPSGAVSLANPRHRLRTYMRDKSISKESVSVLRDYLEAQNWRVGPGFLKMLNPDLKYHWIRRYHFVDHDHEQETLFLDMIEPGIVGRTLPIMAR